MTASAQGLDVSNWQGHFDWSAAVTTAAKAGAPLAFGICRVTQGLGGPGTGSPDPDAAWNWAQIAAHGLYRGAYHFFDPRLDGPAQARYFVRTLTKLGLGTSAMLWLDNEADGGLSPLRVSIAAQAFMHELAILRPHNPQGVYANFNFARNGYCAGLGRYPLWIAWPSSRAPGAAEMAGTPWKTWTFWQWGARNGIDADAFNGTRAELDAWIGSFQPAAPKPAPQPKPAPTEGPDMIMLTVDMTTAPAGSKDPGKLIQYANGNLRHIQPSDGFLNSTTYAKLGVPGPEPINWADFQSILEMTGGKVFGP